MRIKVLQLVWQSINLSFHCPLHIVSHKPSILNTHVPKWWGVSPSIIYWVTVMVEKQDCPYTHRARLLQLCPITEMRLVSTSWASQDACSFPSLCISLFRKLALFLISGIHKVLLKTLRKDFNPYRFNSS